MFRVAGFCCQDNRLSYNLVQRSIFQTTGVSVLTKTKRATGTASRPLCYGMSRNNSQSDLLIPLYITLHQQCALTKCPIFLGPAGFFYEKGLIWAGVCLLGALNVQGLNYDRAYVLQHWLSRGEITGCNKCSRAVAQQHRRRQGAQHCHKMWPWEKYQQVVWAAADSSLKMWTYRRVQHLRLSINRCTLI